MIRKGRFTPRRFLPSIKVFIDSYGAASFADINRWAIHAIHAVNTTFLIYGDVILVAAKDMPKRGSVVTRGSKT